jgi:hypothetical protein
MFIPSSIIKLIAEEVVPLITLVKFVKIILFIHFFINKEIFSEFYYYSHKLNYDKFNDFLFKIEIPL